MLTKTLDKIEYPESDGEPMSETDVHYHWMVRLKTILRWRYRNQKAYVGGNLFVFYEEGVPSSCVSPDCFVVLDCEPGDRRTFKTWEEQRHPEMVIEVTSKKTKSEDQKVKPVRFAALGVSEYFMYDPTSDYLSPPLIGLRIVDGEYVRIEPDVNGALVSEKLGMSLTLDGNDLVLRDVDTGEVLITDAEHFEAEAQRARRAAQRARRDVKESRGRESELQAELWELRKQLGKEQGGE